MPTTNDGLSAKDIWDVAIHVLPILGAVVLATVKIVKVLRDEIRSEIGPIMDRIDKMEETFKTSIRDLWDHQTAQDQKIDAVTAAHNRLRGAHDAIVTVGGHAAPPAYTGPERRREARPPKCGDHG